MDESIEEMNLKVMALHLKYALDYINKAPLLMQIGSTFSCVFFSLHVAAQSNISLFILLMVFSLLTLAVLFISHQQFS